MSHATQIYSYCRSNRIETKKEKFSLKRDLRINGVFYFKCIFIAAMLGLVMRGFIGV